MDGWETILSFCGPRPVFRAYVSFREELLQSLFQTSVFFWHSLIWMFPKIMGFPPQIIYFNRVFHYKSSILGVFHIFGNTHINFLVFFEGDDGSPRKSRRRFEIRRFGDSLSLQSKRVPETPVFVEQL